MWPSPSSRVLPKIGGCCWQERVRPKEGVSRLVLFVSHTPFFASGDSFVFSFCLFSTLPMIMWPKPNDTFNAPPLKAGLLWCCERCGHETGQDKRICESSRGSCMRFGVGVVSGLDASSMRCCRGAEPWCFLFYFVNSDMTSLHLHGDGLTCVHIIPFLMMHQEK